MEYWPSTPSPHQNNYRTGLSGLPNIGSTCYQNAIWQALATSAVLLKKLSSITSDDNTNDLVLPLHEGEKPTKFINVLAGFWCSLFHDNEKRPSSLPTHEMHRILQRLTKYPLLRRFSCPRESHDAEEFLGCVLHTLTQENPECASWFTRKECSRLLSRHDHHHEKKRFIGGTLQQENIINVPLRKNGDGSTICSVVDALHEYYCGEEVTYNQKTCTKQLYPVQPLPPILFVALKRFVCQKEHNGDFSLRKLTHRVHFSEFLLFQKERYELFSVIHHQGDVGGGHYWTVSKVSGDKESSSDRLRWFCFNDSKVFAVCDQDERYAIDAETAYILCYQRHSYDSEPMTPPC